MHPAKCPTCGRNLDYVQIEPLEIRRDVKPVYDGVSYSCPHCHIVLAVGLDPVWFKAEILTQLLEELKVTKAPR